METPLTLVRTLQSEVDRTGKLIYTLDRNSGPTTIEVCVVDKNDGKDILCVPTQINCAQACRFCHTTQMAGKVAVSNLTAAEMSAIVQTSWVDAGIDLKAHDRPLLVSFMGVGEPLANEWLVDAMIRLGRWADGKTAIRFGLATMLPEKSLVEFRSLTRAVEAFDIPLKVHLSLHYPTTAQRREWMPTSATVGDSLAALATYRKITRCPVEVHYTLISGVNDSIAQIYELGKLMAYHGGSDDPLPVKFLHLNPLPGDSHCGPSLEWVEVLQNQLLVSWNVRSEYYVSPGSDIAASCGMFLTDIYIPSGSRKFGILDESQTIGVAKNLKIGDCHTTGFDLPRATAEDLKHYRQSYAPEQPMETFGPTRVELSADTFAPALRLHKIVSGESRGLDVKPKAVITDPLERGWLHTVATDVHAEVVANPILQDLTEGR